MSYLDEPDFDDGEPEICDHGEPCDCTALPTPRKRPSPPCAACGETGPCRPDCPTLAEDVPF